MLHIRHNSTRLQRVSTLESILAGNSQHEAICCMRVVKVFCHGYLCEIFHIGPHTMQVNWVHHLHSQPSRSATLCATVVTLLMWLELTWNIAVVSQRPHLHDLAENTVILSLWSIWRRLYLGKPLHWETLTVLTHCLFFLFYFLLQTWWAAAGHSLKGKVWRIGPWTKGQNLAIKVSFWLAPPDATARRLTSTWSGPWETGSNRTWTWSVPGG